MTKRLPLKISRRHFLATVAITATALPDSAYAGPMRSIHIGGSPGTENEPQACVATALLRSHYGYDVKRSLLQKAVEYAALGKGDIDVMVDCYLEGDGPYHGEFKGGHANFVQPIADKIIVIGRAEGPMDQGFVVPTYVDVNTMEGLKANRDRFNNKILGGDPSWGLSQAADRANKSYDLGFELVLTSEDAMMAALKRAVTRREWICITGWHVHPMWIQYDLKYVDDPKKVFGAEPLWHYVIARKGFDTDFPEATRFFGKYHIPNDELARMMAWMLEGKEAEAVAERWIGETRGKGIIESWLV